MLDPTVESIARSYTDDVSEEIVAVEDIRATPHENQNRGGSKILADNVEQMFYAHMQGVKLPPIVLRRTDKGQLFVIDGNHRVAMYREHGIERVHAYVCTLDDHTFSLWVKRANIHNGRDVGDDRTRERMAADEVMQLGIAISKAAAVWAVSADRLGSEVRRRRGRAKLQEAGVSNVIRAKVSMGVAEQLQDMEAEHVKVLAPMLDKATADEIKMAKRIIAQAPSREREAAATTALAEVESAVKARKGPANSEDPYTAQKAKRSLNHVINGVKSNRSLTRDEGTIRKVEELADLFGFVMVRKQDEAA